MILKVLYQGVAPLVRMTSLCSMPFCYTRKCNILQTVLYVSLLYDYHIWNVISESYTSAPLLTRPPQPPYFLTSEHLQRHQCWIIMVIRHLEQFVTKSPMSRLSPTALNHSIVVSYQPTSILILSARSGQFIGTSVYLLFHWASNKPIGLLPISFVHRQSLWTVLA